MNQKTKTEKKTSVFIIIPKKIMEACIPLQIVEREKASHFCEAFCDLDWEKFKLSGRIKLYY